MLSMICMLTGALLALGCGEDAQGTGGGNGTGGTGGSNGGGIAGLWVGEVSQGEDGYSVCFYVNQAGTQLTPSSDCDIDQVEDPAKPFSYELRVDNAGTNQDGNNCGFGLGYEQSVAINNNSFEFSFNPDPNAPTFDVSGTISGNSASGTAKSTFQGFTCELNWMASKVNGGGTGGTGGSGTGGTGGTGTGGTGGSGTGGTGGSGTGGTGGSTGGITPGLWAGTDVCLFVNQDGTALVPSQQCDVDQQDSDPWLFEWQPSGLECGISFPGDQEPQSLDIRPDGTFRFSSGFIEFEGTFSNGNVSGTASTSFGCPDGDSWSATPAN
jgi:hypothetical protein